MVKGAGFEVLLELTGSIHASLLPISKETLPGERDLAEEILAVLPQVVVVGNQVWNLISVLCKACTALIAIKKIFCCDSQPERPLF